MSFTVLSRVVLVASLTLASSWPGTVRAAKAQTGASVVAQLYKDFAWEAIGGQTELFGEDVSHQSKTVLEGYFDTTLAALLVRDASCQASSKGMCNLDFDPLFNSQDPRVVDLDVALVAPGHVVVEFKDPVSAAKTKLEFKVALISGKWKITDIIYRKTGASLRKILTRRLPSTAAQ